MQVGSAGGFLVPEQLLPMVMQVDPEEFVITARCTSIPPTENAPDAPSEIPFLDQGGEGISGGVELSWIGEAVEKPQTEPVLKLLKLEPQEISGHVVLSDKLLRNAGSSLDIFLRRTLAAALNSAQERTFINGTGVGQPLGIIGHPSSINVARAGAGAVAYADLVNMLAQFGPSTWSKGFWMIHQSVLPQILQMATPLGQLVFQPRDMRLGLPQTLIGLPCVVGTRQPVLGARGDVMLVEPSFYLRRLGFGPSIEISNAPRFTRNQSILKIFGNCDGQPWLTDSILMEDGVTRLSPFIVLDA